MNPQERAIATLERQAQELLSAGDTAGARRMLAAAERTAARLRGEVRDITAADLKAADAAIDAASAELRSAREARRQVIADAVADGWTYAAVGEVLGIGRARVAQLVAS